ncbi:MAG: branched-chain amino acid ABC transporter permease [Pararobbsia sp.]
MDIFIQQLINGLVLGSVYAIIALGYTMVYGILGIINFAHGDVLMIGAMVALSAINVLQTHFPALGMVPTLVIALIVAAIVCSMVGYTIERVAYRPLRNAPRLAPLITAIARVDPAADHRDDDLGPQPVELSAVAADGAARCDHRRRVVTRGQSFSVTELIIIVVAFLTMGGGCCCSCTRPKLGRAMRATAENRAGRGP